MQTVAGITLDTSDIEPFLPSQRLTELEPRIAMVQADLEARQGPGADFLGWLDLPGRIGEDELASYTAAAAAAREDSQAVVVIGIGGSYLGTRAVLDALGPGAGAPEILFAGTGLSSGALAAVRERVADRDFRLCVISKSGTTLEPAVAFRILRADLEARYGPGGADRRITVVTDVRRGALRDQATERGWESFVIPDDVGGRFSVLTPVGLLPLAIAGIDVAALVRGAAAMHDACRAPELRANPAHLYAAVRYGLHVAGYDVEVLASFHPGLATVGEWWKQLFGESEGKDRKGIFPASAVYTRDLHSLGQYLQDGRRALQETFLFVREDRPELAVPSAGAAAGGDGLDYLVGRSLDAINREAYRGTRTAHGQGGVPCQALEIERLTPEAVGALLYFFEKAVAVSGRLLEVNPFDQPGVEAYKQEMFRLLGKPAS